MSRVVHFEIHAGDPDAVIGFYGRLFGWKFTAFGPPGFYWLINTGDAAVPGINGGLVRRRGETPARNLHTPVIAFVCTIDVDDVDRTGEEALQAGAMLAHPKSAIPGNGWVAYYKDPDGNIFGIYQADKNAR